MNPRSLTASANSTWFESYKQNNEPMLFSEPGGLFRPVTRLLQGYGSDSGMFLLGIKASWITAAHDSYDCSKELKLLLGIKENTLSVLLLLMKILRLLVYFTTAGTSYNCC